MVDIFLSYSRKDIAVMHQVRDRLHAAHFDVWTDENLQIGTQSWRNAIQQTIEETKYVIVLLSPHAKVSDWIEREVAYAETHQKAILPVLIAGDEKTAVPIGLVNYQRLDLRSDILEKLEELIEFLKPSLVVTPDSPQGKQVTLGEVSLNLEERNGRRFEFWRLLLERSKGKTQLFSKISPSHDYWLGTGSGRSGLVFNYFILKDGAGIDLSIDVGDYDQNKVLFDHLSAQRAEIESEFGEPLEWRRLDNNRTSRVVKIIQNQGNLYEEHSWESLHNLMIDLMIRFNRVMRPRIAKLGRYTGP